MDKYTQEQYNTELVDYQLNLNLCEQCGQDIKYKIVEDKNEISGEIETGHLPDCLKLNI